MMGFIPDLLFYLIVSLYLISTTFVIVLFVGWLTCTDYYYRWYEVLDCVFHWILASIWLVITLLCCLGFITDNYNMKWHWIISMLSVNAFIYGLALVVWLVYFVSTKLIKVREYFADKRGRT